MKKWVKAADVSEFRESDRKMVDLGGKLQIGLFNVDGAFHAISAWCSHQRATMVHGPLNEYELTCPFHGARFDIRSGRALCLPAVRPVTSYAVKVDGDEIFLKV